MQELFFVIKSLIFTCLIVFAMQFKVGGTTLESQANSFIKTSSLSIFLQQSAHGGVKALKELQSYTTEKVSDVVNGAVSSSNSKSEVEKEKSATSVWRRSDTYERTHSNN